MQYLWAPWRMEYILSEKGEGCFLCLKPRQGSDHENFILHRGRLNFVLLNTYPYNPGHLMVAPYRHAANLEDLTEEERHDHIDVVNLSLQVLGEALSPGGFNIGINSGRVAGAGLEDHVHTHIVPRWPGDTNYMPVIASTRVVPEGLSQTYEKLRERFAAREQAG